MIILSVATKKFSAAKYNNNYNKVDVCPVILIIRVLIVVIIIVEKNIQYT